MVKWFYAQGSTLGCESKSFEEILRSRLKSWHMYNWPLNNFGVMSVNPNTVYNSGMILQLAFCIYGSTSSYSAAAAKSLQSCPTLCDPIDGSPPDSPVPGILQARTLEWVAISFSNTWKWKVKVKSLSSVRLVTTPWTAAYQAPPPMGFSRQECWSGVPLPSPKKRIYDVKI